MVSSKQKKEIGKHMERIKEARENGSKKDIERATNDLLKYLESEGLMNRFDE